MLAVVVAGVEAKEPKKERGACVPYDDASLWICKYGKPDVDDSTAYDKPRPPIVTRWLIYKKEGMRVTYVPDALMGDPPPYKKWSILRWADRRCSPAADPKAIPA